MIPTDGGHGVITWDYDDNEDGRLVVVSRDGVPFMWLSPSAWEYLRSQPQTMPREANDPPP